jgi:hypothetical protein
MARTFVEGGQLPVTVATSTIGTTVYLQVPAILRKYLGVDVPHFDLAKFSATDGSDHGRPPIHTDNAICRARSRSHRRPTARRDQCRQRSTRRHERSTSILTPGA